MPTKNVNGITRYYEIHGSGEPLMIIQGMGVDLSSVEPITAAFAENYRVIAFDSRGVGRTDKPDIPYSIEMMVTDTLDLMDALSLRQVHILGVSMGSMIAIALAAADPKRVNGLVLHVASHRVPFLMNTLWRIMWNTNAGRRKMIRDSTFLFNQKYPPTPESFVRMGMAPLDFDGRNVLPNIHAPTLILNGTTDQVVPMSITRELAQGIKGARLILADGDHLFSARDPDLLIKPALEFLAEVDRISGESPY